MVGMVEKYFDGYSVEENGCVGLISELSAVFEVVS